jgi:hypothetical protein
MKRPVVLATEARTAPSKPVPTPAAKARARAVEVFAHRIRRAIERAVKTRSFLLRLFHDHGFDPLKEPGAVEHMAERFTAHVESIVAAYNGPRRTRGAVLARLAEQWQFIDIPHSSMPDGPYAGERDYRRALWEHHGAEHVASEETRGETAGEFMLKLRCPSNVSLDDIAAVVARSNDPDAVVIERSIRDGRWFVAGSHDAPYVRGSLQLARANYRPLPEGGGIIADKALARALSSPFNPRHAVLIAWAEKSITEDQQRARFFPLPASKEARIPFEVMARGESYASGGRDLVRVKDHHGAFIRVAWDGRPRPEQLSLAFALRGAMEAHVFRAIVKELKGEGLRDYVILHRMAAAQGRTGRLFWTWEAHKQATSHEQRVRSSTKRDAEARDETIARIWRLATAELHVEVERHGKRAWKVIGEAPLVNVTGGVEQGGQIEGLELVLNPALYEGAMPEYLSGKDPYFTQIPEAVLRLPSLPFCLAVMLGFRFRYAHDTGGVVTLSGEDLHGYLEAARWRGHHRADATDTLHNALDAIARTWGDGCRCEPVEGGNYRITPSRAWVDAVVHDVPPELPPSRAKTPKNGAELIAWREARDLSQREAARELGVGIATIKRAELRPTEPLPRAFREVDWSVREPARPSIARELPDPSDD